MAVAGLMADELIHARTLHAHALGRARMSGGDFRQEKLWLEIAEQWLARAAGLEDQRRGAGLPGRQTGAADTVPGNASKRVRRQTDQLVEVRESSSR